MKVLSLFDGMGCGMIALKELGIEVEYFSSEIDKFPLWISNSLDMIGKLCFKASVDSEFELVSPLCR